MLTRRDVLRLLPASALMAGGRAAEAAAFERIDSHIHIHRDAPALLAAIKASSWRGLDIVVCPASGDEPFDLEEKLRATLKVHRDSGGTLAWALTFDARGFEGPGFADRTIAQLRRTFDDGAIGVKIWKNIGMSIKSKSGAYLLPDDPALLPIYEAIQRADRTLVAHLAEPNGAWLPLDDKNPEIRYYSSNPQWHMYGKAGRPSRKTSSRPATGCSSFTRSCAWSAATLAATRTTSSGWRSGSTPIPTSPWTPPPASVTSPAATGTRSGRSSSDTRTASCMPPTSSSATATRRPRRSLQARHDRDWDFFSGDGPMEYDGRPTRGLALADGVLRKIFRENALRWLPGIGA